jgi:8-oxo-dGTP diphosphatase
MAEPEIKQRIALKAVIINEKNEALILREGDTYVEGTNIGKFGLPGGRLDPGEAWDEGLRREVKEETGLEVEILHPVYIGEWRPVIKGVPHQIVAVFVACRAKDTSKIRLSEEHDHFEWVTLGSMKTFNLMDPDDKVLEAHFAREA